jgi:hypothetical protein
MGFVAPPPSVPPSTPASPPMTVTSPPLPTTMSSESSAVSPLSLLLTFLFLS